MSPTLNAPEPDAFPSPAPILPKPPAALSSPDALIAPHEFREDAATPLATRVFTRPEAVTAFAAEWDRLQRRLPCRHIQHDPDWLAMELRSWGGRGGIPMVAAARRGDEVVGVAPFLVRPWDYPCRVGYVTLARFRFLTADLCGESLLAAQKDRSVQEALLQAIATADTPYQMLVFEGIPVASPLWKLLHESPTVKRHFWLYQPETISPRRRIRLAATYDEYLTGHFGGKSRRKLQQTIRKLEKACSDGFRFEEITRPDQVPDFLTRVTEVQGRSWQGQRLNRIDRTLPEVISRYQGFAERGWLRSFLLSNGDTPLAFGIGLQYAGVYHYDSIGFDQDWFSYAPGKVLFCLLLEQLYANQTPELLDCGYGENDYKRFFTNESYEEANLFLFRKSVPMARVLATRAACSGVSRLSHMVMDTLQLRENLRRLRRGRKAISPA